MDALFFWLKNNVWLTAWIMFFITVLVFVLKHILRPVSIQGFNLEFKPRRHTSYSNISLNNPVPISFVEFKITNNSETTIEKMEIEILGVDTSTVKSLEVYYGLKELSKIRFEKLNFLADTLVLIRYTFNCNMENYQNIIPENVTYVLHCEYDGRKMRKRRHKVQVRN